MNGEVFVRGSSFLFFPPLRAAKGLSLVVPIPKFSGQFRHTALAAYIRISLVMIFGCVFCLCFCYIVHFSSRIGSLSFEIRSYLNFLCPRVDVYGLFFLSLLPFRLRAPSSLSPPLACPIRCYAAARRMLLLLLREVVSLP